MAKENFILIAEIGNNHFGNLDLAKTMIKVAFSCGATLVKLQAFKPGDFKGSMPDEFYKACAFTPKQYEELLEINPGSVFYSIFNKDLDYLGDKAGLRKVSRPQYESGDFHRDADFISVPLSVDIDFKKFNPENSRVMVASEYMEGIMYTSPTFGLMNAKAIKEYGLALGYSCHSTNQEHARVMAKMGAPVIEKHFCMQKNFRFKGKLFRDTVHGADPMDLYKLAKVGAQSPAEYHKGLFDEM